MSPIKTPSVVRGIEVAKARLNSIPLEFHGDAEFEDDTHILAAAHEELSEVCSSLQHAMRRITILLGRQAIRGKKDTNVQVSEPNAHTES